MSDKKDKRHFGNAIIKEVKEMVSKGKTQKEMAEHFGLKDRFVIMAKTQIWYYHKS